MKAFKQGSTHKNCSLLSSITVSGATFEEKRLQNVTKIKIYS